MRSPDILRNGEALASPSPRRIGEGGTRRGALGFHSTVSLQKLRRFNTLALVFRVVSFCFLLASTVFMAMDSHTSPSPRWFDHRAFRYLVAVNSLVGVYSFFEMGAALWEMLNGDTLMPETVQLWFDFTHDQAFAYLLFSANSSATTLTQNLRSGQECTGSDSPCGGSNAFCIQSYISIALGFAAFLFLAASAVLSGFRVACFITTGYRFHV